MNAHESGTESGSTSTTSCKSRSSCCSPHTSLLVAGIAIVIAVYALVAGRDNGPDAGIQDRLSQIEEQISSINTHLDQLGEDVKSNREHLIHTKLQKALENVQEIGQMATTETRSRLAEIETMLHDIISPVIEEAPPPEIAPVEPPVTESVPAKVAPSPTAPAEPAPVTETAPADVPADTAPANEPATSPEAPSTHKTPAPLQAL